MNIADKLIKKIKEKENPVCVGLDPQMEHIPQFLKEKFKKKYGETKKGVGKLFIEFNKKIIDSVCELVPAVKPNIAFYEKYGSQGIEAFEFTVNYARQKGLIVIGDCKRNDLLNTASAYAQGYLGEVELFDKTERGYDVDIIVVNAYMGSDTINPFVEVCKKFNKGIFVLVKTSNPSSVEFQELEIGGKAVFQRVAILVKKWGKELIGDFGYSSVGMVVGATCPKEAEILRKSNPKAIFLVPGYGKQGAGGEDITNCFNKDGLGAIINSSRKICYAYKFSEKDFDEKEYVKAAEFETKKMIDDINENLAKVGKSIK